MASVVFIREVNCFCRWNFATLGMNCGPCLVAFPCVVSFIIHDVSGPFAVSLCVYVETYIQTLAQLSSHVVSVV